MARGFHSKTLAEWEKMSLKLHLPATLPEAQVTVGTRKKIKQARKALEK